MPFQKTKELTSGVSGNYWRVMKASFDMDTMKLDLLIKLYKDNTPGLSPLGLSHQISVVLTVEDLMGDLITLTHQKVLEFANSDIPNVDGNGTHKGCADLVGATIVA